MTGVAPTLGNLHIRFIYGNVRFYHSQDHDSTINRFDFNWYGKKSQWGFRDNQVSAHILATPKRVCHTFLSLRGNIPKIVEQMRLKFIIEESSQAVFQRSLAVKKQPTRLGVRAIHQVASVFLAWKQMIRICIPFFETITLTGYSFGVPKRTSKSCSLNSSILDHHRSSKSASFDGKICQILMALAIALRVEVPANAGPIAATAHPQVPSWGGFFLRGSQLVSSF